MRRMSGQSLTRQFSTWCRRHNKSSENAKCFWEKRRVETKAEEAAEALEEGCEEEFAEQLADRYTEQAAEKAVV